MSRTRAINSWINTLAITAAAAVGIVAMSSHLHPAASATAATAATTATTATSATVAASTPSTGSRPLTPISVTYHGHDDGGSSTDY